MSTATRGFASMDPEKRHAFGRIGGIASQQSGKAYRFTSETAREAGIRGRNVRYRAIRERWQIEAFNRKRKRKQTRSRKVVPPVPEPVPVVPIDPKVALEQHLKKVVTDALGITDKK